MKYPTNKRISPRYSQDKGLSIDIQKIVVRPSYAMEPSAALDCIFDDFDYNGSDGCSSEEEDDYPECRSYEQDMLDRYQVCLGVLLP